LVTLTEFLLARIAEDEWVAEGARRTSGGEWLPVWLDTPFDARMDDHIARHDPARVLAECEAKRRIVERCTPLSDMQVRRQTRALATDVLCALASVYADHPEFQEEWRAT
jgi:hypothetical protein